MRPTGVRVLMNAFHSHRFRTFIREINGIDDFLDNGLFDPVEILLAVDHQWLIKYGVRQVQYYRLVVGLFGKAHSACQLHVQGMAFGCPFFRTIKVIHDDLPGRCLVVCRMVIVWRGRSCVARDVGGQTGAGVIGQIDDRWHGACGWVMANTRRVVIASSRIHAHRWIITACTVVERGVRIVIASGGIGAPGRVIDVIPQICQHPHADFTRRMPNLSTPQNRGHESVVPQISCLVQMCNRRTWLEGGGRKQHRVRLQIGIHLWS